MFPTDIGDITVAYVLLGVAIVMLFAGLAFKHFWLFLISGFAWIIAGIFFMSNAPTQTSNAWVLGIICVVIALPTFLAIYWTRDKKEPADIIDDKRSPYERYSDRMEERVTRMRRIRNTGRVNRYAKTDPRNKNTAYLE